MTRLDLRRRTLVHGAAWAVPTVVAASVAPAYAASCPPCTFAGVLPDYWTQKKDPRSPHIDFDALYKQGDSAWSMNRDELYANAPGGVPQWDQLNSYGVFNHTDVDMIWWDCDWSINRVDGKTQSPEQIATVKVPIRNLQPCSTYKVRIITEGRGGWDRAPKTMPTLMDVQFVVGGSALTLSGRSSDLMNSTTVGYETWSDTPEHLLDYDDPITLNRIPTYTGTFGAAGFNPNPDVYVSFTVPSGTDTSNAYMFVKFTMPKPSEWQYADSLTQRNNDDFHLSAVLTQQSCTQ